MNVMQVGVAVVFPPHPAEALRGYTACKDDVFDGAFAAFPLLSDHVCQMVCSCAVFRFWDEVGVDVDGVDDAVFVGDVV